MNLYLRELKAGRKSLIGWSIGMFFMVAAGMNKYGAYQKAGQSINVNELFKGMPKGVAAVFGIGSIDLSLAIGYFTVLFMYLTVMGAIHASLLGSGILTKEELDKTAEFLYAKPISRARVITGKLLAALTDIVILNIVTLVSSVSIVGALNKGAPVAKEVLLLMAGLFIAQVLFLSVGMAAAAVFKKPKLAAPAATGYLFAAYFLSLWLDISSKFQNLKYLTPFKYFTATTIVKESALDPVYIALSAGIILVMIGVTYVFYRGRDLHI